MVTTRFVDQEPLPKRPAIEPVARLAALGWLASVERRTAAAPSPWTAGGAERFTPHEPTRTLCFEHRDGRVDVGVSGACGRYRIDGESGCSAVLAAGTLEAEHDGTLERVPIHVGDDRVWLTREGTGYAFRVVPREERWLEASDHDASAATALLAPFPGVVTAVDVAVGDEVHEGDIIVVLEAMKMLHSLPASGHGTVSAIHVEAGMAVETGAALVSFELEEVETPERPPA